jgi:hypothetical protein
MAYLEKRRLYSTKITWIKAHDKDKGNNYVDTLAGKHTETNNNNLNIFRTPIDPTKLYSIKHIPYIEDVPIESTLRKTFQNNNGIKNLLEHVDTKTFKKLGLTTPFDEITDTTTKIINKWDITNQLIHGGTKTTSTFTTASISDNRTYRTKAFHNQLPTQNIMKQRMPNIYPDEKCRCCNNSIEDNIHMWTCETSKDIRDDIIFENIIPEITKHRKSTNTIGYDINKSEIHQAMQILNVFRDEEYSPTTSYEALEKLYKKAHGVSTHSTEITKIKTQGKLIQFHHLCRGIAPDSLERLLEIISMAIQTRREGPDRQKQINETRAKTNKLFIKILDDIIDFAKEEIWKPRCDRTIEWEKTRGIHQKHKRNKIDRTILENELTNSQRPNTLIHINAAPQILARVDRDNSKDQEGPTPQEIRVREDSDEEDNPLQPLQKKPKRNNRTPIMIRLRVPIRPRNLKRIRLTLNYPEQNEHAEVEITMPNPKKRRLNNLARTTEIHIQMLLNKVPINRMRNQGRKGKVKGR